jgi:hypothetical protein
MKQFKEADYGPYVSGVYTSPLNNKIELKRGMLVDLNVGRNANTVVCCKVIALIPVKGSVPL